jgi:MobL relaxases
MNSSSITPGVVLKVRFVTSNKKAYQDYVDYVDRDDAKKEQGAHEKLFTLYQDYLSNPDKTSALFTQQSDRLDEEEKKKVKQLFQQAQENHSIMWQDVITFHNPWLEEQGLYDSRSHTLDEKKVMDITRKAMNEMLKREKLNESAVWSAAIHYNTDNIHIHIATVELHPTRERGMRKQKSIDAMKSQVVNQMMDRGDSQKKINDLIRKHMVGSKQKDSSFKWRNRELKPLFLQIYNHLPEDKRQWQYSYNTLKPLKPYIDELSRKYIEKYHAKDYQAFLKKLDKEVDVLKKAYGEGKEDRHRYKHYKQNKIDELYKRMGNAFLKEMKEYDRKEKALQKKRFSHPKQQTFTQQGSIQHAFRKMERAFKTEYESWKNQRHYERLQQKIERNHEQEREY